uniref:EGF-like domain-containing protein n=1 Tax=Rhabditophanes sp. KR3021 TaxID=114890 RepID=A0AC35TFU5_9BILA
MDKTIDCMSGFDEQCPTHYFVCKDRSACLDPHKYMDGKRDCVDGSDEPCPAGKFLCHDQKNCVSLSQFQDGIKQCNDGSDEECTVTQFQCSCGKKRCIDVNAVHDGVKNCEDGSDEGFLHSNGLCPDGSVALVSELGSVKRKAPSSISTCPPINPCSETLGQVCLSVGGTWRCVCKIGTVRPHGSSRCVPVEMVPQFFAKPDVNCSTVYNDMLIQYRQFYSAVPRIQFKEESISSTPSPSTEDYLIDTTLLKQDILESEDDEVSNIKSTQIKMPFIPKSKKDGNNLNILHINNTTPQVNHIRIEIQRQSSKPRPVQIKTTDNVVLFSAPSMAVNDSEEDNETLFTNITLNSPCDPLSPSACSLISGTCKTSNSTSTCQCTLPSLFNPLSTKCVEPIDECSKKELNNCDSNAICLDNDFSYSCLCREGFIDVSLSPITMPGIRCKRLINECLSGNVCGRNSICIDTPSSFVCKCEAGFVDEGGKNKKGGSNCVGMVDECLGENECDKVAFCRDLPIGYNCLCPHNMIDVSPDPIQKPGRKCVAGQNKCGDDECNVMTSVCLLKEKATMCACKPGFKDNDSTRPGFNCTQQGGPDPCADTSTHDCAPSAQCISEPNGLFSCVCPRGFTDTSLDSRFPGRKCNKITNVCALGIHECHADADCYNTNGGYNCRCRTGFAEVSSDPLNKPGRNCRKDNQCASSDCHVASECRQSSTGPICQCTAGFVDISRQHGRPPGRVCKEIIDECKNGANDCSAGAACIDTATSFTCRCKENYRDESPSPTERPGRVCIKSAIPEAPECNVNDPLSCNKDKHEVCLFINSGYKCVCPDKYSRLPDGRCLVINECLSSNLNTCSQKAECIDLADGYICRCKSGFVDLSGSGESGRICKERINECLSPELYKVNCHNNAICVDTEHSYDCRCRPGFTDVSETINMLPGRKCVEAINECSNNMLNDCSPNSSCEDTKQGYLCHCNPGFVDASSESWLYSGRVCIKPSNNIQIDQPNTKPGKVKSCDRDGGRCGENEVCSDSPTQKGKKTCNCAKNSVRDVDGTCKQTQLCDLQNECSKDAICSNLFGSYKCQCRPGFHDISTDPIRSPGRDCQELVNECAGQANTCSLNANCFDKIDGYSCECKSSFIDTSSLYGLGPGRKCSTSVNECASDHLNTCDENSDCIDTPDGYVCQCFAGYVDVSSSASLPPGRVCTVQTTCPKQKTDLVFLIDGSGSIGSRVFQSEVLRFVAEFVDLFDIGPDKTRVGLIQYSDQIRHEFDLNQYSDKTSLLKAISTTEYLTGLTRTGAAIQHMVNEGFNTRRGARPDNNQISKVAIIMTDGRSQDNVTLPAIAARDKKINTFSIGVTDHVLASELEAISGSAKNWFYVQRFKDLDTRLRSLIQKAACPPLPTPSKLHQTCNIHKQTGCNRELNEICIEVGGKPSCECTPPFTRHPLTRVCGGDLCNPQVITSCIYPELCKQTPLYNHRCACEGEFVREPSTGRCIHKKSVIQVDPPRKHDCSIDNGKECGENESCLAMPVSSQNYKCECKRAYERSAISGKCELIGSCDPHNSLCDTRKHEQCLMHPSGKYHVCQCGRNSRRHPITGICLVNECLSGIHDCNRNAICTDLDEGYLCSCKYGFRDESPEPTKRAGRICVAEVNECVTGKHNCDPNAYCIDTKESFVCQCKSGFVDYSPNPLQASGLVCKGLVNECLQSNLNDCSKDANCIDTVESYKCVCKSGFDDMDVYKNPGRQCFKPQAEDICAAGVHSCDRNARCITKADGDYTCLCNAGFIDKSPNSGGRGRLCIPIIHFCDNPSLNNCDSPDRSYCIEEEESYRCKCKSNFLDISPNIVKEPGRLCKPLVNECYGSHDCAKDGGICEDTPDSYKCYCAKNYLDVSYDPVNRPGRKCKLLLNECENGHDCYAGAQCTDTEDSFICKCPENFIDVSLDIINRPGRRCLLRVNECLNNQHTCSSNADCTDTDSGYTCKCRPDFTDMSPDPRNGGRICKPALRDECTLREDDCHQEATCIDLPQGFTCTCNSNFLDQSPNRVTKPGRLCERRPTPPPDECRLDNQNSCKTHLNEVCRIVNGVPKCACPQNYERNPRTQVCDVINECLYPPLNDCNFNSKCIDLQDGYRCECKPNFKDVSTGGKPGILCQQKINECVFSHTNDCSVNGICIDLDDGYECRCKAGFKDVDRTMPGRLCKQLRNECLNPSHNSCSLHAMCTDKEDGYECSCKSGYLDVSPSPALPGRSCRELVDECRGANDCDRNAKCVDTEDSYKCICPLNSRDISPNPAFPGRVCLQFEDECTNGKADCARDGGVCRDNEQGFTCECAANYIDRSPNKMNRPGRVCVRLIDECKTNRHTCSYHADCRDLEEGYSCECHTGYVDTSPNMISQPGRVCSAPHYCPSNHQCSSAATCEPLGGNKYKCVCIQGYHDRAGPGEESGRVCVRNNACKNPMLNTCSRNAICYDEQNGYRCECISGFEDKSPSGSPRGRICEETIPQREPQQTHPCQDPNLNECARDASCIGNGDSYTCQCNPGFVDHSPSLSLKPGRVCAQAKSICLDPTKNDCDTAAFCFSDDSPSKYNCKCRDGYIDQSPQKNSKPGRVCVEMVNECLDRSLSDCDLTGTCTDLPEGYSCRCGLDAIDESPDKINRPGRKCYTPVNECSSSVLNNCSKFGMCIDEMKGYKCQCQSGYFDQNPSNPGTQCKFIINECESENLNDCSKNAVCIDQQDGYTCRCNSPYRDEGPSSLVGRICRFDECKNSNYNSCDSNAQCIDTDDSYMCRCQEGFYDSSPNPMEPGRVCLQFHQQEVTRTIVQEQNTPPTLRPNTWSPPTVRPNTWSPPTLRPRVTTEETVNELFVTRPQETFTRRPPTTTQIQREPPTPPPGMPCGTDYCDLKLGEVCISGWKCDCRPNEGRSSNKETCKPIERTTLPIRIISKDSEPIYYSSSYGNPSNPVYIQFADDFTKDIGRSFASTNYAQKYVNSDISYITHPKMINSSWPDGVLVNFTVGTIKTQKPINKCDMWDQLMQSLQRSNGQVGGGKLGVPADVDLLNPCAEPKPTGEKCGSSYCDKAELGEICIANSVCGCPDGMKRKDEKSRCFVVEGFNLPLLVIRDGLRNIAFNETFENPITEIHKQYSTRLESGISESYPHTNFKDSFISSEVNDITNPKLINGTWDVGLMYNTTVFFKKGAVKIPQDTYTEVVEYIRQKNNYEVGNCNLFINPYQSNPFDACYKNECHEKGICIPEKSVLGYRCECGKGYRDLDPINAGHKCLPNTDYNECLKPEDNSCSMNARCIDQEYLYKCECLKGYSDASAKDAVPGSHCVTDFCADVNFCPKNTTCINMEQQAECRCDHGFQDIRRSEVRNEVGLAVDTFCMNIRDIDECKLGLTNCSGIAECTDKAIGYSCACPTGYIDGNANEPGRLCASLSCGICNYHGDCVHSALTQTGTGNTTKESPCVCSDGWSGEFCEKEPSKLGVILAILLALLLLLLALCCLLYLCTKCHCFKRRGLAAGYGRAGMFPWNTLDASSSSESNGDFSGMSATGDIYAHGMGIPRAKLNNTKGSDHAEIVSSRHMANEQAAEQFTNYLEGALQIPRPFVGSGHRSRNNMDTTSIASGASSDYTIREEIERKVTTDVTIKETTTTITEDGEKHVTSTEYTSPASSTNEANRDLYTAGGHNKFSSNNLNAFGSQSRGEQHANSEEEEVVFSRRNMEESKRFEESHMMTEEREKDENIVEFSNDQQMRRYGKSNSGYKHDTESIDTCSTDEDIVVDKTRKVNHSRGIDDDGTERFKSEITTTKVSTEKYVH